MKYLKFCLMLFIIFSPFMGDAIGLKKQIPENEQGIVYYFGFDIRRIYGIQEADIEKYGCKYKINRNDFFKSLLPYSKFSSHLRYQSLDIRAKVIFANTIFFIDRRGIVKLDEEYMLLDKKNFISSLTLIPSDCGSSRTGVDEPLVRKPTFILATELVTTWFGSLLNDLGSNATSGQNNTSLGVKHKWP